MDVLEGIQVVDLSHGIAGPVVGMFLADFGAEVVKVEPPDGDPARSEPGFAAWNRGKKGVIADPGDPGRGRWLAELIAGADVLLVSDPAVFAARDLDRWKLLRDNPRLVLAETPAYAGSAPWHRGAESHGLLSAALGVAWRQSSCDGVPVEPVGRFLLQVHGVWAAVCTVAALLERERSGYGQLVTVSGAQAVLEANVASLSVDPAQPDPPTGIGVSGRHPTYTRFVAADGKWLVAGALGGKFEAMLLHALGLSWILAQERMGGRIENLLRPDNVEWAKELTAAAFKAKNRDDWLQIMTGLGIPCGPLGDRDRWLDHPQIQAIGMRAETDDPERGHVVMPGVPINLTGTPGRVRNPAPALGQHDAAVAPRAPKAPPGGLPPVSEGPLSGIRVLDMGTFVAGPYSGTLLAELGAEVIKVEPPAGDPFRVPGFVYNRGLRSLALNLRPAAGLEAFRRLARTSDVVINSTRPGVAAELAIDYQALSTGHPALIEVSNSAFGEGEPLAGRPGVDMVLQGMSGMMSAQGGDSEPVANTIAIIDVTTSAMLALSAVLALLHRERSKDRGTGGDAGHGQRAWVSLAATSAYLQTGELVRYRGRPPAAVGGRDYQGADPFDRYYPVADGFVRLHAPHPDQVTAESLIAASLPVEPTEFTAAPATALARVLAGLTASSAADRLNAARIPAVPARRVSGVIRDPQLLTSEFLHVRSGPAGTSFVGPGRLATFGRTPRHGPLRAPGTGEHSVEVLRTAGLTGTEIELLVKSGIVTAGQPIPQEVPAPYR
jgi:crotonobetainyl-CoA:carnitine CoA-transferase CaiB-like acyl-CoA transferase